MHGFKTDPREILDLDLILGCKISDWHEHILILWQDFKFWMQQ